MAAHTSYRSFYATFWDDADLQALSHLAYRVLTTLKGTLSAAGIGPIFDDVIAERCACTEADVLAAYVELERPKRDGALGWIVRERGIVWVVNGLKYEPTIRPSDAKHRKHVAECLALVGGSSTKITIIRQFKQYYRAWFPVADALTTDASDPHAGQGQGSSADPVPDPSLDPASDASPGSGEAQTKTTLKQNNTPPARTRAREGGGGGIIPIDAGRREMSYLTRCVVALNTGMQSNPLTSPAFSEIAASSQSGAVEWEADGIDIATVERVIGDLCTAFRPKPGRRQISSLKYFDQRVRERWTELLQRGDVDRAIASPSQSSPERIAILRKQGYSV